MAVGAGFLTAAKIGIAGPLTAVGPAISLALFVFSWREAA